jgi:hypothetical protein
VLSVCLSGQALSQEQKDSADRYSNDEILALPEREQRLWVNALVQGIATGIATFDDEAGACISRWFFGNEAQAFANIQSNMERFPDHHPSVIVMALVRRECAELSSARRN